MRLRRITRRARLAQVFWTDTSQEELFDSVAVSLIDHSFSGFNSCCFAYGQTGSGKTFSMFGDFGENRGIIPRAGRIPAHAIVVVNTTRLQPAGA